MADWSQPKQLRELAQFYVRAQLNPDSVSDAEVLEAVKRAFWPASCWSFVEAAFAIIAPACSVRPHLARQLIAHPIEAMVAGGLEDGKEVIAQGMACATNAKTYVEPTLEGKRWLLEEWPLLEGLALEVFREALGESRER